MSKIYYYDIHHPLDTSQLQYFYLLFSTLKGLQISLTRLLTPLSHGGFNVLDLSEQLKGRRASQVWKFLSGNDWPHQHFKLKLQLALHSALAQDPTNFLYTYVWWECIWYKEFITPGKTVSYRDVFNHQVLTTAEQSWITAWYSLRPAHSSVNLSLTPTLMSEILNHRLTELKGPFIHHEDPTPQVFHHRAAKTAERHTVLEYSQAITGNATRASIKRFWDYFNDHQTKGPVLDNVKLLHLGYLSYRDPQYHRLDSFKGKPRPGPGRGWKQKGTCFLCHNPTFTNTASHIYSECPISLQIWEFLFDFPRPKWTKFILNTSYTTAELHKLHTYLGLTFYRLLLNVSEALKGHSFQIDATLWLNQSYDRLYLRLETLLPQYRLRFTPASGQNLRDRPRRVQELPANQSTIDRYLTR